jgi:hypothetical protein
MAEKIKKYVKKELESGSSPEEVRETLIAAGWEEEEVKVAINMVLNGDDSKVKKDVVIEEDEESQQKGRGKERVRLFLFVLVIVMVVLLFAGMLLAFTSIDPQIIFG